MNSNERLTSESTPYRPLGDMSIFGFNAITAQEVKLTAAEVLWIGDWHNDKELWILPGFMDAHRHIPHGFELNDPIRLSSERAEGLASLRLEGVSNVLDMGVGVLEPWEERPPWVKTALQGIEGKTDEPASGTLAAVAADVEDCVRHVEAVAEAGADHVKVFATATGRFSQELAIRPKMTKDQIFASVKTAKAHGLPVVAHCHGGPALWTCLEAGVASIEHGLYMSREDLMACVDAGVRITLTNGVYLARHGARIHHRLGELVRDVLDVGVAFAVGTDSTTETMGRQVALLIELGMPAHVAIAASVGNPTDASCMLVYDKDPTKSAEAVSLPRGIVFPNTASPIGGDRNGS